MIRVFGILNWIIKVSKTQFYIYLLIGKPVLKKILSENDKKGVSYGISISYYVKNQKGS